MFAEDESSSSAGGTQPAATTSQTAVTTSVSATTSTIHSRDPSPMKEYLKGFGKRSTSVDAGMIDGGTTVPSSVSGPASGSDTWRLFHEIKGKIAKTVEEKFGEIKTDRRSSSSVFSGSSNIRAGRLVGGGSKDDSSINSDSEDISESSGRGLDSKSSSKKEKKDESSPKKVNFPKSTSLEAPSTSGKQDIGSQSSAPTTPSKSKKQSDKEKEVKPESASVEQTFVEEEEEEEEEEEVESGVEVDEQMTFSTLTEFEDENIPTIDYRQPFPVTKPPLVPRQKRKNSFVYKIRWWAVKLLPFIAILLYYIFPLPPFLSGFISGIAITLGISVLYSKVKNVFSPHLTASEEFILQQDKEYGIPDYIRLPILEIPPIKEYHHINKYHVGFN